MTSSPDDISKGLLLSKIFN